MRYSSVFNFEPALENIHVYLSALPTTYDYCYEDLGQALEHVREDTLLRISEHFGLAADSEYASEGYLTEHWAYEDNSVESTLDFEMVLHTELGSLPLQGHATLIELEGQGADVAVTPVLLGTVHFEP